MEQVLDLREGDVKPVDQLHPFCSGSQVREALLKHLELSLHSCYLRDLHEINVKIMSRSEHSVLSLSQEEIVINK